MTVAELSQKLGLKVLGGKDGLNKEITGGYTSDLLSDVMGFAESGSVWITIQTHKNVMAIASLKELACIVLAKNNAPDDDMLQHAEEEGIAVLVTSENTFEISGRIYELIK